MRRIGTISLRLSVREGLRISLSHELEVSLDCPVCARCRRTVVFQEDPASAVCHPTCHPFPGRIVAKAVTHDADQASLIYTIAYEYEPFTDVKYPTGRVPTGEPRWARLTFDLTCPLCGATTPWSDQSNMGHPYTHPCKCLRVLSVAEYGPELSWMDDRDNTDGSA